MPSLKRIQKPASINEPLRRFAWRSASALMLIGVSLALVGLAAPARSSQPTARGTTLAYQHRDTVTAVSTFGCAGNDGARCAPFEGDTPCMQPLPLLCIHDMAVPPPRTLPPGGERTIWLGGVIATTPEVTGHAFATAQDADGYCEQQFGPGWHTLSIEAGRAVNFRAYGFFGDVDRRAWVDVSNGATCWAGGDSAGTTQD